MTLIDTRGGLPARDCGGGPLRAGRKKGVGSLQENRRHLRSKNPKEIGSQWMRQGVRYGKKQLEKPPLGDSKKAIGTEEEIFCALQLETQKKEL